MIAHERLVEPVLDAGGFAHGFTYAGNPLACAAGLGVLDEIARQNLCANAETMGEALIARLHGLMQKHELIGDVRGKGLLTAFELMADRATKAPLPAHLNAHQRLVDLAYERGLIVYSRRTRDGTEGDHILVCPPLILEPAHLDEIVEGLDAALAALADEPAPRAPRTRSGASPRPPQAAPVLVRRLAPAPRLLQAVSGAPASPRRGPRRA